MKTTHQVTVTILELSQEPTDHLVVDWLVHGSLVTLQCKGQSSLIRKSLGPIPIVPLTHSRDLNQPTETLFLP